VPSLLVAAWALACAPALAGERAPAALAGAAAGALFFYSTLDNMDGKQARRVRAASALGLLFDHGCDAVNAALVSWLAVAVVAGARAGSWQWAAWFLIPNVPFVAATIEEFHTGARGEGGRARAAPALSLTRALPPSRLLHPARLQRAQRGALAHCRPPRRVRRARPRRRLGL